MLLKNIQALLIFDPLYPYGTIFKPYISKCSIMPEWHQLSPRSGHVEESETMKQLQLYPTSRSTSSSTRLPHRNYLSCNKMQSSTLYSILDWIHYYSRIVRLMLMRNAMLKIGKWMIRPMVSCLLVFIETCTQTTQLNKLVTWLFTFFFNSKREIILKFFHC